MTTPIRRQYLEIKRRFPQAIVFFRLGDFYETFDDDAKLVARELEITLTSKPMGKNLRVPLAGVPHHSLQAHLKKLVSRGYKVAICEQLEDPRKAKGLVDRDVVRVVTPGTVVEEALLSAAANNYLVAVAPGPPTYGLAYVDITTGEFAAAEASDADLALAALAVNQRAALANVKDLRVYSPSRFLVLDGSARRHLELFASLREGGRRGSLLDAGGATRTALGARLPGRWLGQPLLDVKEIDERLDRVERFFADAIRRARTRDCLGGLPDVERIVGRVLAGVATPRDLAALRRGLAVYPGLLAAAEEAGDEGGLAVARGGDGPPEAGLAGAPGPAG